jgi:hemolysin III
MTSTSSLDHIDLNDIPPLKPKLRGVIHQYSFFISLIFGPLMIWRTVSEELVFATTIYSLSVSLLFGTSALYHRINWAEVPRMWMRRLDHTMIFVLIAGTYTPLVYTKIDPEMSRLVLNVVWWSVGLGALLKLGWPQAPKWLSALIYCALGWFALVPFPALYEQWGWGCVGWLIAGGILYTMGVLAYVFKRPNLVKNIFGYHELFHSFVVLAAACHYLSIAYIAWSF